MKAQANIEHFSPERQIIAARARRLGTWARTSVGAEQGRPAIFVTTPGSYLALARWISAQTWPCRVYLRKSRGPAIRVA